VVYLFLQNKERILDKAMAHKGKRIEAVAYMRTSSATNVGDDKDSERRQRLAIEGFAKAAGYAIKDWFYDAAVKGSDPVTSRPGFAAMLDRIAGNGVRTIIVESPDRFARDLAVQLTGHDYLRSLGVTLIPASAPDHFTEDTPTAVLVRQVLGAIAQFEKAATVAKLKAARERSRAEHGKCEGRKSYAERDPAMVAAATELSAHREPESVRPPSLRWIAAQLAERGYLTPSGKHYSASAVQSMLG
jgi:DNA invertase Pin-like site-specific DNA recombinase